MNKREALEKKFAEIPGFFWVWLKSKQEEFNPVNPRRPTGRGKGTGNSDKTHCRWGHPYDKENTRITKVNGREWRQCRACDQRKSKDRYHREKLKRES